MQIVIVLATAALLIVCLASVRQSNLAANRLMSMLDTLFRIARFSLIQQWRALNRRF